MALARVKTYWAEMDATDVASRGSYKTDYPPSTILRKSCRALV